LWPRESFWGPWVSFTNIFSRLCLEKIWSNWLLCPKLPTSGLKNSDVLLNFIFWTSFVANWRAFFTKWSVLQERNTRLLYTSWNLYFIKQHHQIPTIDIQKAEKYGLNGQDVEASSREGMTLSSRPCFSTCLTGPIWPNVATLMLHLCTVCLFVFTRPGGTHDRCFQPVTRFLPSLGQNPPRGPIKPRVTPPGGVRINSSRCDTTPG
jgi:hypothetical protein